MFCLLVDLSCPRYHQRYCRADDQLEPEVADRNADTKMISMNLAIERLEDKLPLTFSGRLAAQERIQTTSKDSKTNRG